MQSFKGIPCLEFLDIMTVIFFASGPRDSLWRPRFCSYFHTNSLTDSPKQNCEVRKIVFSCILFAIATICCQYYYGRESLAFLSSKKRYMYLYSAVVFAICVIASVISNDLIWQICDLIIAFLAIYNLVFLVILSKEVEL